jgi:hypothetical protein
MFVEQLALLMETLVDNLLELPVQSHHVLLETRSVRLPYMVDAVLIARTSPIHHGPIDQPS